MLLISQWLFPIWSAYYFNSPFFLVFVPIFHLLSYVVCQRLLIDQTKIKSEVDRLYSLEYYRWLFLNTMWSINNSFWLKHLVGTPFYNAYLRLCGAKIERHSHIYTTLFDAPWLIEVGESTFIGEEVVFSNLSYQDQTYELHRIQIGSYCSVDTRSVLYGSVVMEDYVYAEPMSSITGHIATSDDRISVGSRSFSFATNNISTDLFILPASHSWHAYLLCIFHLSKLFDFVITRCCQSCFDLVDMDLNESLHGDIFTEMSGGFCYIWSLSTQFSLLSAQIMASVN